MQWKERARWIKFEEDVEQNDRWGKPHIASLSFHSLLELRKGIESGMSIFAIVSFIIKVVSMLPCFIWLVYFHGHFSLCRVSM